MEPVGYIALVGDESKRANAAGGLMLEWNEEKRLLTLEKRDLDFADCERVFSGRTLDIEDTREDYGECRIVSFGFLDNRMMVITWTQRGENRRIISMRKANEREITKYSPLLK